LSLPDPRLPRALGGTAGGDPPGGGHKKKKQQRRKMTYTEGDCWWSKKFKTQESNIHGTGIVATEDIEEGEYIWIPDVIKAVQVDFEHIKLIPNRIVTYEDNKKRPWGHLAEQVGPNIFRTYKDWDEVKEEGFGFINHNCDPNVWYNKGLGMTRRKIKKGEELTFDYALFSTTDFYNIVNCRCGSTSCRGALTREDWKKPELRERYKGHFSEYIMYLIEKEEKEKTG